MSAFNEKLVQFELKKKDLNLQAEELNPKIEALQEEFKKEVSELDAKYTQKINALKLSHDNAVASFRAEQKAYFGLADGERMDIFELVKAIRKIKDMP